jgi:uncharacterized protein involved in exopolysaccharide biosynthesis
VAVPSSREADIGSVVEILRSRALLEEVADRVGAAAILGEGPVENNATPVPPASATPRPAKFDAAVRTLARSLTAESIKKSTLILIGYEGPSPEVAQAIVTAVVDLVTTRHMRLSRNPRAHQFLTEQVGRLDQELSAKELKLRKLKQETGLFAPEGQRQAVVTRIARLQDELLQTTGNLAAAEKEVALLRDQLATLPATQVTARLTGAPGPADEALRVLLGKEADLLTRYPADHPEVVQVHKQVEVARERAARDEKLNPREQVTTGPNKLHDDLRLAMLQKAPMVEALKARQAALDSQLREERTALSTFLENELRLTQQQREVDLLTASYKKYAENLEQTQIDRALEEEKISNLSVAQPATFDPQPVRPRLSFNLALGLAFALVGSLALGWLLDSLAGATPQRPRRSPEGADPQVPQAG